MKNTPNPFNICKTLKVGDIVSGELKPDKELSSFYNIGVVDNDTDKKQFTIKFDFESVINYSDVAEIKIIKNER